MRRGGFDTRRPTAVAAAGFAAFAAPTTTTCRLGRNAAVSAELKIATPTSAQQNHAFRTERPAFAPEDPAPTVATPAAAQIGRSAPFSGPRDPFRAGNGDAAARRRPRVRRETTCRRGVYLPTFLLHEHKRPGGPGGYGCLPRVARGVFPRATGWRMASVSAATARRPNPDPPWTSAREGRCTVARCA